MAISAFPDDPIEQRLATGFARISAAMRSRAWERAVAHRLTPTQLDILTLLQSRNTGLRLSLVAEQLGISRPTASEAVATLVGKGLAEKSRAGDDRRAVGLRLTASGAGLLASLRGHSGLFDAALGNLTDAEKAVLLKLLIKMIRGLQERGEIAAQRLCVSCKYFSAHQHVDPNRPHHCRLVNAAFGDGQIRLDCPEHEEADGQAQQRNWAAFVV